MRQCSFLLSKNVGENVGRHIMERKTDSRKMDSCGLEEL
ncbi:unnamed protein product [Brugia timori]|uniref:Uncharacterized protein n=1 Tax=Brugia timori TaxID=42155 RepID=A0A0R3RDV7_9BILA|nr:unnamed protein product [Brugia timori]